MPGWLVGLSRKLLLHRTQCRVLGQCWGGTAPVHAFMMRLSHVALTEISPFAELLCQLWSQSGLSPQHLGVWVPPEADEDGRPQLRLDRRVLFRGLYEEKKRVSGTESGPTHTDGVQSFPLGHLEMGGWNAGWLRQLGKGRFPRPLPVLTDGLERCTPSTQASFVKNRRHYSRWWRWLVFVSQRARAGPATTAAPPSHSSARWIPTVSVPESLGRAVEAALYCLYVFIVCEGVCVCVDVLSTRMPEATSSCCWMLWTLHFEFVSDCKIFIWRWHLNLNVHLWSQRWSFSWTGVFFF